MKTGQRFIITTGEYSDYGIRDSFVALKDFSFDLALKRWLDEHGDKEHGEVHFGYGQGQGEQDFLAWLRSEGLVVDEELNTVHLSDYSRPHEDPAKDCGDEPGQVSDGAHSCSECGGEHEHAPNCHSWEIQLRPPCSTCAAIQAADASRHFKGCPKRVEKDGGTGTREGADKCWKCGHAWPSHLAEWRPGDPCCDEQVGGLACGCHEKPPSAAKSRSVLRREAIQRGEPAPSFSPPSAAKASAGEECSHRSRRGASGEDVNPLSRPRGRRPAGPAR